jgi:nicotinate-nucleotide adenylyltransferase
LCVPEALTILNLIGPGTAKTPSREDEGCDPEGKMKVAMFGGSFDPVHIGHLYIAEEARVEHGYDRIYFVPAYHSPLKNRLPRASAEDRYRMLREAISNREEFAVLRCELDREGRSFTIDTVRDILSLHPDQQKIGMIIGDDLLEDLRLWKDIHELTRLVDIVVASRIGKMHTWQCRNGVPATYRSIDNSPLPVSSSVIRRRIEAGKNIRYLVPEGVYAYLAANNVYSSSS